MADTDSGEAPPTDATEGLAERIFLNGFMGSGKSTVGPLVAGRLGWRFIDLDERIEEVIGMPIAA